MFETLDSLTFLVTGGAGFMGSAFIRHLLKNPAFIGKVINLDALTYSGSLQNLADVERDFRYQFIHNTIEDKKFVSELLEKYAVDVIVHFAAETHVDRSIHDPESFLKTNVMGTFQLLECVKEQRKIHFHHISTDEVYGALSSDGCFHEGSVYQPNSPYAASKAASDHLVMAYAKTYGISVTISHACNNYGPFQYPEKFIPLCILCLLENKPIPIYGSGRQVREWMYVEDHAEAILHVLRSGKRGETYNLSSGIGVTNLSLVRLIIDTFAESTSQDATKLYDLMTHVQDRPGHDFRYAMETTKMKQELGFTPRIDLKNGIKRTIQWYLEHPSWIEDVKTKEFSKWSLKHYRSTEAPV